MTESRLNRAYTVSKTLIATQFWGFGRRWDGDGAGRRVMKLNLSFIIKRALLLSAEVVAILPRLCEDDFFVGVAIDVVALLPF